MALHIRDSNAERAVRELAEFSKMSLTDTIRIACQEKLQRERRKIPVTELLADLHAKIRAYPRTGEKADKAFFDQLWGDSD